MDDDDSPPRKLRPPPHEALQQTPPDSTVNNNCLVEGDGGDDQPQAENVDDERNNNNDHVNDHQENDHHQQEQLQPNLDINNDDFHQRQQTPEEYHQPHLPSVEKPRSFEDENELPQSTTFGDKLADFEVENFHFVERRGSSDEENRADSVENAAAAADA